MKLPGNARTCPNSRRLLIERITEEDWSVSAAAAVAGISERTGYRWLGRWRREGAVGLLDRSSRPLCSPTQLPAAKVRAIRSLRELRMTAAEIAEVLSLALSTVSLWLKRIGLGKRSRLQPPEPPNRYERRHAGELVHVDIKQLGRISARGAGHRMVGHRKSQIATQVDGVKRGLTRFEYVHVMIDDYTRLAYAEVLPSLTASCAIEFLRRAVSLVRRTRRANQGGDERQRLGLHRSQLPQRPGRTGAASPAHPPLPPTHQWQGGEIHPDARQRVGLRADLRQLR